MKLNRAKVLGVVTAGALLLLPGAASAASLSGNTSQPGQSITLKIAADGSVKSAHLTWETKCKGGTTATGSTTFRKLKRSTPTGFSSSGKDVDKKGKLKLTFRSQIDGDATGTGFKGTFKSKVKVEKKGKTVNRCNTRKIRWSAS
jgi:hypothetical protein